MDAPRLFCAIGLILGATVVAGSQAPPVQLSEALRAHLKMERFDIVTSIRGLPLGIRNELQALWRSQTLDIADPQEAFQGASGGGDATLPTRRLVAAACSNDHCLVYYERGGSARTRLVALFHWTPERTRLEAGGTAPGGLETIDDVWHAVLSGAVRQQGPW